VAISNSRLVALDDRGVTFRWKDYREHGRTRYKTMSLATEEFMIDIASINKTFTAAFCKIMPPRTPVASCCKTFHCWHDNRLLNSPCRYVLGSPPTHIDHATPPISASLASADVQIPIVPRRC
jgi:hypothetical protein